MRYIAYALVGDMIGEPHTRHSIGLPPELTGGKDTRTPTAQARVLLITEEKSGIFLYRYTVSGEFAGDTWHENIENARYQAGCEYGDALGEWQLAPAEVTDLSEFIRALGL